MNHSIKTELTEEETVNAKKALMTFHNIDYDKVDAKHNEDFIGVMDSEMALVDVYIKHLEYIYPIVILNTMTEEQRKIIAKNIADSTELLYWRSEDGLYCWVNSELTREIFKK